MTITRSPYLIDIRNSTSSFFRKARTHVSSNNYRYGTPRSRHVQPGHGSRRKEETIQEGPANDLTEEQSKKVEEIIAKHKEALTATAAKRRELVNADANKKMAEARKAAQAEGKKGKDLQAAVMAASGLSEEDQKKLAEISQETQKVAAVMKQEVAKILSEEQREKTGLQMKKGRKKKKK